MHLLQSFVPLLVIFLIQNTTAKIYFPEPPLEVPAFPTAIYPSSTTNSPITYRPTARPVTESNKYTTDSNHRTVIGGSIIGHTGNFNGAQFGNVAGLVVTEKQKN